MRKSIEIYIVFSFGLFLTSDSVRGDEAEQEAPPAPAKKGGAILRVPTPFPAMTAVALTANGDLVAVAGSENTVRVWDVADGKELHTLKGHGFTVITLAFSPDGKSLASATGSWLPDGAPGELKLWDMATGKERVDVWDVRSLATSPPKLPKNPEKPAATKSLDEKGVSREENRRRFQEAGFNAHLTSPAEERAQKTPVARPVIADQEPMDKGNRHPKSEEVST